MNVSAKSTTVDATQAILRIGVGLLFIEHALQKFGFLGGMGPQTPPFVWTAVGTTAASIGLTRLVVAAWIEAIGGLLFIVGFVTRPVAFVLFAEMTIAFFWAHCGRGGSPLQNGGESPLFYAFVFAFLMVAGPGAVSVDEALRVRS